MKKDNGEDLTEAAIKGMLSELDDKIGLTTKMSEVYKSASKAFLINMAEEKVKQELEAARLLVEGPKIDEANSGKQEPIIEEAVNIDIEKGGFDFKPKTANTTSRAGKVRMNQNASNLATLHKS